MSKAFVLSLLVLIASASACSNTGLAPDLATDPASGETIKTSPGTIRDSITEEPLDPAIEKAAEEAGEGFVPAEEPPANEIQEGNPSLAAPVSPTVNEPAAVDDTIIAPSKNPGPVSVNGKTQYTATDQLSATAEPRETDKYTASTNLSANYSPNPNLGDYVGLRKPIVIRCDVLPCE